VLDSRGVLRELVETVQTYPKAPRVVKIKTERHWKELELEFVSVTPTTVAPCEYNFHMGERHVKLGKGKAPKWSPVPLPYCQPESLFARPRF
jgi:hypothetical protein